MTDPAQSIRIFGKRWWYATAVVGYLTSAAFWLWHVPDMFVSIWNPRDNGDYSTAAANQTLFLSPYTVPDLLITGLVVAFGLICLLGAVHAVVKLFRRSPHTALNDRGLMRDTFFQTYNIGWDNVARVWVREAGYSRILVISLESEDALFAAPHSFLMKPIVTLNKLSYRGQIVIRETTGFTDVQPLSLDDMYEYVKAHLCCEDLPAPPGYGWTSASVGPKPTGRAALVMWIKVLAPIVLVLGVVLFLVYQMLTDLHVFTIMLAGILAGTAISAIQRKKYVGSAVWGVLFLAALGAAAYVRMIQLREYGIEDFVANVITGSVIFVPVVLTMLYRIDNVRKFLKPLVTPRY